MENRNNRTCCVNGCSQAIKTWMVKNINASITFHCLPRPKEVRKLWIEALLKANGPNWVPKSDTRVCSLHFGEYCWETGRKDGQRKLKWRAVPLYFNLPAQIDSSSKVNYSFDQPYCSGIFKKRNGLSDITNKQGDEHTYSRMYGASKRLKHDKTLLTNNENHAKVDTPPLSDLFRQKAYLLSESDRSLIGVPYQNQIPANHSLPQENLLPVFAPRSPSVTNGLDLSTCVPNNETGFSTSTAVQEMSAPNFSPENSPASSGVDFLIGITAPGTGSTFSMTNYSMEEGSLTPTVLGSTTTENGQSGTPTPGLLNLRRINVEYLHDTAPVQSKREEQLNLQLNAALEQNRLLKENLAFLERAANRVNKQNVTLRKSCRTVTRRNVALQNRCRNLEENISTVFNKDQIEAMGRKSTQGMKWESATIKDSLILKMKCGTAGYEEIRKKLPYPSARTLQRQVEHITFESGIIDGVFDMILMNIKNCTEEELDCMLAGEEMAIDPSEMIDPSSKQPIGRVTLKSHDGIAHKALVFILGGISSRWKQTVAYYFTRAKAESEDVDAVGRELSTIVLEIIKRAEAIGLRVHSLTTDMGPENRAMWRVLGVTCTREKCVYAIPHPVRKGDSLCIVPDVPHLFKSLKRMLISHGSILLPDDIVSEENLPTNEVKACHIKDLLNFQDEMDLKIAPKPKKGSLTPKGHFQGMKVGNARGVVS